MAKKKARSSFEDNNTPSLEDEADILAEAGAVPDENGELVVDEETVLKLGAVDAESIRENRRMEHVAGKKAANIAGVSFNSDDPVVIFDTICKSWGPSSVHINVKRLTGTPVQDAITSLPRSGMELLAALKDFHVQKGDPQSEATYEVKFRDAGNKQLRGTGRITIPAMRSQQGQGPMNAPPQYSYGGAPFYPQPQSVAAGYPPGYPQPQAVAQYPQGAPPQPPPAAPVAPPQQPPSVHVMPQPGPDPMAMMQQMFGMFKQMQESFAAQSQPQPQPQPAPQALPQMPPPPQSADPGAMIGWMQQMFQMFQQMQTQQQPAQPRSEPAQPQMNPMAMGMPPVQTPPGMMWLPPFGFVRIDSLMQALGGSAPAQPSAGPGPGMYRPSSAHRPPYTPGYGGQPQGQPPYQPQPPPQRQMTPAEQLRDALTVVRTVASAVEELREFGIGEVPEAPVRVPTADEDSPVQVIDTGPAKIVVDKKSGALRPWETGWANADKILKWAGEQREAYQRNQIEHQRGQQQPVRQLPPDHIEVPVGQPPPPGYYAVDPQQASSPLPPPPAHMPPPIQSTPAPRRTWGMPTVPDPEGEGY